MHGARCAHHAYWDLIHMETYKFQVTDVYYSQVTSNRVSLVEQKHQVSDIDMVLLKRTLFLVLLLLPPPTTVLLTGSSSSSTTLSSSSSSSMLLSFPSGGGLWKETSSVLSLVSPSTEMVLYTGVLQIMGVLVILRTIEFLFCSVILYLNSNFFFQKSTLLK
jgi:hypothetical protein